MRLLLAFLLIPSTLLAQSQLDNLLSPSRLPYLKNSKLIQISSTDTTGGNDDFISIPPGATARLADIKGPAVITNFWATISSSDKYFLRRILLRFYWDGEPSPSVEVPIGDFFGTGFEYKHYVTPFLGMSSGGYYCYFPMPFNKSARVEVVNETGEQLFAFYYHIDYQALTRPLDPSVAYFHATWHREIRTDTAHYYTLLEARGEGHLVGINMNMQSYNGDLQFLEGDEVFYVDGERKPSIRGTGTEDYFNSGWYFNHGEFAAPYHGLILKDDTLGRIAAYRFHVLDVIPFKKSIRALIEHGHRNQEVADYSSTAFWYQKEPHRPFAPMLPAVLRIPLRVQVPSGAIEAESLKPSGTTLPSRVQDMSAYGPDWSGFKQLRIDAAREGDSFSFTLPAPEERYDVDLYYTKGPDYADVMVSANGKSGDSLRGYEKTIVPGGRISLKDLVADSGKVTLRFVTTGKDRRSTGYAVGLDAFAMRLRRSFIPAWLLAGPFPNPVDAHGNRRGLDSVYPPELDPDPAKTFSGVNDQTVAWRKVTTPENGSVDLSVFDPNVLVVAYARTDIVSSQDQTLPLLLGSDDGVKVFLNGKEVYRLLKVRGAQADQDTVPLKLKKGLNTLLLKIENNLAGYAFYARIPDPGHTLGFSLPATN